MAIRLNVRLAKGETAPSTNELLAATLMGLVEVGQHFTAGELRRAAQLTQQGATNRFLRHLRAEGVVTGAPRAGRYRLAKPVPAVLPRTVDGVSNQAHQHVWNVLRGSQGRSGISRSDLRLLASTESLALDESIDFYLTALVDCGILREDEKGLRLLPVHNTGPLPPRIYRAIVPVDANRRAVCVAETLAQEVTR
tara:strand:+ start:865 stop:1449 length:585 start_codon:yes stop_codon:yes gene_type:complete